MSRKVFISVLGTGFYEECVYKRMEFESASTKFIQAAMLEYYGSEYDWKEDDKAYILVTQKAKRDNWESGKRYDRKKGEDVQYIGLKEEISNRNLKINTESIVIPEGKDENEMWEIFSLLYNLLEDSDELYIDVTHSFRSLPMLLLVFCNYVKFIKNVKVKGISYGNYEARDSETNRAPIFDLLPLSELDDWTYASRIFVTAGKVTPLSQLVKNQVIPIISNKQKKKYENEKWECARAIKDVLSHFEAVVNNLEFCRGKEIIESEHFKKSRKNIDAVGDIFIPPLKTLWDKIDDTISRFENGGDSRSINNLKAAQWCYDYGHYQSCVTFLLEGITTWVCEKSGEFQYDNIDDRKIISDFLRYSHLNKLYDNPHQEYDKLEKIKQLEQFKRCAKLSSDLRECRNDFNHAGMRGSSTNASTLSKQISTYMKEAKELFNLEDSSKSRHEKVTEENKLFYNISNHPSAKWSEQQIHAATNYGEIKDIPFPDINPEADIEDIKQLVEEYAIPIIQASRDSKITAHIMGEQNFSLALVNYLISHGITCVASTTKRNVTYDAAGTKLVKFDFVKFRPYI